MQAAVQRQEQEDVRDELTPEQVEDLLFEEASALLAQEDEDPTATHEEEDEADPVEAAEAEDTKETTLVEAPQAETAPPDPFADATPDQRQAWQNLMAERARMEHEVVSNRNRVSGLQKKINELEDQLRAQPKPAAPKVEATADLATDEDGSDLSEFQEDFPEIYKAVNAIYKKQIGQIEQDFQNRLRAVTQRIDTVAQPVEHLREQEQSRYRQTQIEALAAAHPDWNEIQNSQAFWQWVDAQTEGVQALAGSAVANDNIALLNLYKSQTGQQVAAPPPSQARGPARPQRQPDVAMPRVNSGGRPRLGIAPKDGEAALDYWLDHWDDL